MPPPTTDSLTRNFLDQTFDWILTEDQERGESSTS